MIQLFAHHPEVAIAKLMLKPPRRTTLDRAREGALATCQHVQRRALSLSSTSAGRAAILGRSWTRRLGAAFPIQRAGIEPSIIGTASYPVLKVDSFDHFLSNCACSIAHAQV